VGDKLLEGLESSEKVYNFKQPPNGPDAFLYSNYKDLRRYCHVENIHVLCLKLMRMYLINIPHKRSGTIIIEFNLISLLCKA
jgi:hypothetical protein